MTRSVEGRAGDKQSMTSAESFNKSAANLNVLASGEITELNRQAKSIAKNPCQRNSYAVEEVDVLAKRPMASCTTVKSTAFVADAFSSPTPKPAKCFRQHVAADREPTTDLPARLWRRTSPR